MNNAVETITKTKQLFRIIVALGLLSQAPRTTAATVAADDFEQGINVSQWAAFGGQPAATDFGGSRLSREARLIVRVPQRLDPPVLLPDGSLQLISHDADGGLLLPEESAAFEVQASTNLLDWLALTNQLRLLDGALLLQDTGSTNHPARFYRMLER